MAWLWVVLILPLAWGSVRLVTPSVSFDFDFDVHHGTAMGIILQYMKIAWTLFFIGLALSIGDETVILCGYVLPTEAPVLLAGSAVYALLFNGWTLWCYERYLHARYPRVIGGMSVSNYAAWKYALTLALGLCAIVCFVAGFVLAICGAR